MAYVLLFSVKLFEREKLVAQILLRFKKGARCDLLVTSWESRGVPGVLDTPDLGWLPGCLPFFLPALPPQVPLDLGDGSELCALVIACVISWPSQPQLRGE